MMIKIDEVMVKVDREYKLAQRLRTLSGRERAAVERRYSSAPFEKVSWATRPQEDKADAR